MAFKPYICNQIEPLADMLCEQLRNASGNDIFNKDYIIVESRGLEQWLKHKIADVNGISALLKFPSPEQFLNKLFRTLSTEINEFNCSDFSPEVMMWTIMEELPVLIEQAFLSDGKLFDDIIRYLEIIDKDINSIDSLKLLQLSEKISEIYNNYLAYRPDCILAWEGNREFISNVPESFIVDSWQKKLWLRITDRLGGGHLPSLAYKYIKLESANTALSKLPSRIFIFGISSMPPFYLDILSKLAEHIDVFFFYRSICREQWGKIVPENDIFKYISMSKTLTSTAMPDAKNELVELMTEKERIFLRLLVSSGVIDNDKDYISSKCNEEETLLSNLQDDILNNRELDTDKYILDYDDSIQFHSFHSPIREIETLHSYLLKFLDESKGRIKPSDILVMAPNIEKYIPFIETVFKSAKHNDNYIYANITDGSIKGTAPETEIFIKILKTVSSRFKVTELFSILSSKAVYKKFGLYETDLEHIHKWLNECAVSWGIDEVDRKEILHTDNVFTENSWKAGLDKMLMGYAMLSSEMNITESIYVDNKNNSILPYDEIEGGSSEVLGKFIDFTKRVFELKNRLGKKMTATDFHENLIDAVDSFFYKDTDTADGIELLYLSVNQMFDNITKSEYNKRIDLIIITAYLENHLKNEKVPGLLLRGGVSFCNLTPIKNIPSKIVCMIGMNEEDFPVRNTNFGFDLMADNPRSCDSSKKDDDRYVFINGILNASKKLYISYIGRSIRDNSEKLSSVLVSELKEYIDKYYNYKDSNDNLVSNALTLEHPLHSFSPKYFTNTFEKDKRLKLLSFSKEYCLAAKLLTSIEVDKDYMIDFSEGLPIIEKDYIGIEDLSNFFKNPSKYLLTNRLDISLKIYLKEELQDKEIIEIDNLENYSLKQELLAILESETLSEEEFCSDKIVELMRNKCLIPPGEWGKANAVDSLNQTITFYKSIKEYVNSKKEIYRTKIGSFAKNEITVNSEFHNLFQKGQVFYRLGSERAVDLIEAWVYHVMLSLAEYNGDATTFVITWNKKDMVPIIKYFAPLPVDEARNIAENLINMYLSGSVKPLTFFPNASKAYADKYFKSCESEKAYIEAIKKWNPGYMT